MTLPNNINSDHFADLKKVFDTSFEYSLEKPPTTSNVKR